MDAEAVIGNAGGIVWIELPPGGARLFSVEPVDGLLPLPVSAWAVLAEAGEVRTLDWRSGLARPDWPKALAAFNAVVVELLPLARGLAEVDEVYRVRRRQSEEEHDAFQAVGRIADLLGNRLPPRAEERATLRWTERFAALRARLVASRRVMNAYEAWLAAYPGFATAALFAVIHARSATPEGTPSLPVASAVAVLTSFALMLAGVSQLLRGGLAVWLLRSKQRFDGSATDGHRIAPDS